MNKINFEGMTQEQALFACFRLLLENRNVKAIDAFNQLPVEFQTSYSEEQLLGYEKDLAEFMTEFHKNYYKYNYAETLKKYRTILKIYSKLADELQIKTSLENAHLLTYLLWNGYLSKDHRYYFDKNRKCLIGGLALTIMNGAGVCLNNSELLKDFLLERDFPTATVVNYAPNSSNKNYRNPVKKNIAQSIQSILSPVADQLLGNHAFNLIHDQGQFYIYDSTQLTLLNCDNRKNATVIDGQSSYKLIIPNAFLLNITSNKSLAVINDYYNDEYSTCPYGNGAFMTSWARCASKINRNQSLLADCYQEARPMIDDIAKVLSK